MKRFLVSILLIGVVCLTPFTASGEGAPFVGSSFISADDLDEIRPSLASHSVTGCGNTEVSEAKCLPRVICHGY